MNRLFMDIGAPEELKKELPLEWLLGKLYDVWGAGYRKIHCPNPEHNDNNPSFNLWQPDERGVLMKAGCRGCSFGGDIFDIVQTYYKVSFADALRIVEEELLPEYRTTGYKNRTFNNLKRHTVEDVRRQYATLVYDESPYVLTMFLIRKQMLLISEYVRNEWRWKGHREPKRVSMPHYDTKDELIGVKLRDPMDLDAQKGGLAGSNYYQLYGAWRDKGSERVLLCEGETDTVWAAAQLQSIDIDVLGLPSGVADERVVTDTQMEELNGRKVFIAFDNDKAGIDGAERLHIKLSGSEIVQVPSKDICASGLFIGKYIKERL